MRRDTKSIQLHQPDRLLGVRPNVKRGFHFGNVSFHFWQMPDAFVDLGIWLLRTVFVLAHSVKINICLGMMAVSA